MQIFFMFYKMNGNAVALVIISDQDENYTVTFLHS